MKIYRSLGRAIRRGHVVVMQEVLDPTNPFALRFKRRVRLKHQGDHHKIESTGEVFSVVNYNF